jgi:hypothetical protein
VVLAIGRAVDCVCSGSSGRSDSVLSGLFCPLRIALLGIVFRARGSVFLLDKCESGGMFGGMFGGWSL